MMSDMTNKYFHQYFHQLLDGLHLFLVFDVREAVLCVSEILISLKNQFPIKN